MKVGYPISALSAKVLRLRMSINKLVEPDLEQQHAQKQYFTLYLRCLYFPHQRWLYPPIELRSLGPQKVLACAQGPLFE
jgi:hypothetical protein